MTLGASEDRVARELQLGLARLREHWLNQAEESFRRVLSADPDHPRAMQFLGVTLVKLRRNDEGCALLQRAAELQPERNDAWLDLAVALHRSGRSGEAEAVYAEVLDRTVPDRSSKVVRPLEQQAFSMDGGEHPFKIVDYPYVAKVRYGARNPAHAGLEALIASGKERYAAFIRDLGTMDELFGAVPTEGDYSSTKPFWLNTWFPPLDAMALQGFLKTSNPRLFVEIGSGMSTKFARQAVNAYQLGTKIISIDPEPRNAIDRICDRVIRAPLEQCPPQIFDELESGDILFLDSSHRSFQNSDVTVFFLEILPRMKPGVVVHIHDIYLPFDYPSGHLARLWNEQYLLATALLFGGESFEVLMPCWYVSQDAELSSLTDTTLRSGALKDLSLHGASFWLRKL
ncbi:MAG: class I SAM-dependent methyltransferase [Microvirga sp.]